MTFAPSGDVLGCGWSVFWYLFLQLSCFCLTVPLADLCVSLPYKKNGLVLPLALSLGPICFLAIYSFLGRLLNLSAPYLTLLSLVSLVCLSCCFFNSKSQLYHIYKRSLQPKSSRSLVLFFFIWLMLLTTRCLTSALGFEPWQWGGEKLFNLHFQTALLFGRGYPPQETWFAGTEINYYMLPKVMAGIAGHFSWHWHNEPLGSGALIHVSDCWQWALAYTLIQRSLGALLGKEALSHVYSSLIFLVAPFTSALSAFKQGIYSFFSSKPIDSSPLAVKFWELSRIVPHTINEYPIWNFLWGDNHSHNAAIWISVTLATLMLMGRKCGARTGAVVGLCAGALALSHSASVIVSSLLWTPQCIRDVMSAIRHGKRRLNKKCLSFYATVICVSLCLGLPHFLNKIRPHTVWHLVPFHMSTPLHQTVNLFGLSLIPLLLGGWALNRSARARANTHPQKMGYALPTIGILPALLGYTTVGFWGWILGVWGSRFLGCFLVLIFPEVVAFNFNMGPEFIRYNSVFKFLFESYILVPFAVLSLYSRTFSLHRLSKVRTSIVTLVLGMILCLSVMASAGLMNIKYRAHKSLFQNKNHRDNAKSTGLFEPLNGLWNWTQKKPSDTQIVLTLLGLKGYPRIVELCAAQPSALSAYTEAGRLSALSGRPSLCGWHGHMFLYYASHPQAVESRKRLEQRVKLINEVYSLASLTPEHLENGWRQNQRMPWEPLRKALREQGVTHVALGDLEKQAYPGLNIRALELVVGGHRITPLGEDTGLVALQD